MEFGGLGMVPAHLPEGVVRLLQLAQNGLFAFDQLLKNRSCYFFHFLCVCEGAQLAFEGFLLLFLQVCLLELFVLEL